MTKKKYALRKPTKAGDIGTKIKKEKDFWMREKKNIAYKIQP